MHICYDITSLNNLLAKVFQFATIDAILTLTTMILTIEIDRAIV